MATAAADSAALDATRIEDLAAVVRSTQCLVPTCSATVAELGAIVTSWDLSGFMLYDRRKIISCLERISPHLPGASKVHCC